MVHPAMQHAPLTCCNLKVFGPTPTWSKTVMNAFPAISDRFRNSLTFLQIRCVQQQQQQLLLQLYRCNMCNGSRWTISNKMSFLRVFEVQSFSRVVDKSPKRQFHFSFFSFCLKGRYGSRPLPSSAETWFYNNFHKHLGVGKQKLPQTLWVSTPRVW